MESDQLRRLSANRTVVLLDYETNSDTKDTSRPLSHAGLAIRFLHASEPTCTRANDMIHRLRIIALPGLLTCLAATGWGSELRKGQLESKLVPGAVDYAVLLPDEYDKDSEPYPLLVLLHGGNGRFPGDDLRKAF
jgi:hypothetical protein